MQSRRLPPTAEAVCACLKKITVQFSSKNMAILFRVYDRMHAAGFATSRSDLCTSMAILQNSSNLLSVEKKIADLDLTV